MLITITTGLICAVLIIFSLLYPLLRKQKRFMSIKKLKFHCISGYLTLLAILVHIHFNFNFALTSGYLSLIALICAIASGVVKKYIAGDKIVYTVHLFFISVLTLTIIYHIIVNALNLLFM